MNRKQEIWVAVAAAVSFMVALMCSPWTWLDAIFLMEIVSMVLLAVIGLPRHLIVWDKVDSFIQKAVGTRNHLVSGCIALFMLYIISVSIMAWWNKVELLLPTIVSPEGEICLVYDEKDQMACHEWDNPSSIRTVKMPEWLVEDYATDIFNEGRYITFYVNGDECAVMELKEGTGWYDSESYCGSTWSGNIVNTLDVIDYVKKGEN